MEKRGLTLASLSILAIALLSNSLIENTASYQNTITGKTVTIDANKAEKLWTKEVEEVYGGPPKLKQMPTCIAGYACDDYTDCPRETQMIKYECKECRVPNLRIPSKGCIPEEKPPPKGYFTWKHYADINNIKLEDLQNRQNIFQRIWNILT